MGTVRMRTIADAAQWHADLVVTCGGCKHEARFRASQTQDYFRSRGWSMSLEVIAQRFRCQRCTTQSVRVRVEMPVAEVSPPMLRPKPDDPPPLGVDPALWAAADTYGRKRLIRRARD